MHKPIKYERLQPEDRVTCEHEAARAQCAGHGPHCAAPLKGAGNKSSVGVLPERSSRLVSLARMQDSAAASALTGFTAKLNSIAEPMRLYLPKGCDLSVYSQDELDAIADNSLKAPGPRRHG